jgi:hypothetical protein
MAVPKTDFATYENFDELFPAQAREEFWMLVRKTLVEVFKTDPQVADRYRQTIEGARDYPPNWPTFPSDSYQQKIEGSPERCYRW